MLISFAGRLAAGLIPVFAMAGAAQAAVTLVTRPVSLPDDGSFTDVTEQGPTGAGVYGVELRLGGRTTWEVGVGTATSQPGFFLDRNADWSAVRPYTVTWLPGALSILIDGQTTSYTVPIGTSNTLRVAAKRDATVTIGSVDGQLFAQSVSGNPASGVSNEILFYSSNLFGGDGFIVTGTARIGAAGGTGSSASEIFFTLGTYAPPVPEPATWALMLTGFGMIGATLRRRPVTS